MDSPAQEMVMVLVQESGGVVLADELIAAGVSKDCIARAVRRGWLVRISHGAFTTAADWAEHDAVQRHLLAARAQQRRDPGQVLTGLSAAVVLGLPLPSGPPARPQVLVPRREQHLGARGVTPGATRRRAWLAEDEVISVKGLRVTTPERTVIDSARHLPITWALAVGDAAAARWGVTGSGLIDRLDHSWPSPGHRAARWVARHLSPLAESPLESLARAVITRAGWPAPRPQVWVETAAGDFRVDLLDEENGVVVEADGRLKYATAEDVWREKLREDALRDTGLEVCRFAMRDHGRQSSWLASYARAQDRSTPRYATETRGSEALGRP